MSEPKAKQITAAIERGLQDVKAMFEADPTPTDGTVRGTLEKLKRWRETQIKPKSG